MTPAKLRANRGNAQHSTGPRSAEGKARASLNARTHGLLSAALVLADESADEFAVLAERVASELAPEGDIERELVSRLAGLLWRLRRLARVETGLFTDWQLTHAATLARARASTFVVTPLVDALMSMNESRITDSTRHGAAVAEAEEFEANREAPTPCLARAFVERETTFANLARYESALESRFYRGLHELQRLQDARAGRPVVPPLVLDVTITGDAGPELRNEPTAAAMLDAQDLLQ